MQTDRRSPIVLLLCFAVAIMEGFDSQILSFSAPAVARDWAIPVSELAIAFSISSLGTMLGAATFGLVSDAIGRKRPLIYATLGFGLFTLLASTAAGVLALSIWRFLTGLCLGGTLVSILTVSSEATESSHQSRDAMRVFVGTAAGAMLGSWVSAIVLSYSEWRVLFYIGGLIPVLIAGLLSLYLRESAAFLAAAAAPGQKRDKPPMKFQLLSGEYRFRTIMLWLVMATMLATIFLFQSWLPTILSAHRDIGSASLFSSLIFIGTIVSIFGVSPLADRVGPGRLTLVMLAIAALTFVILEHVVESSALMLGVTLFVLGMSLFGAIIVLSSICATIYPAEMRASGAGWGLGVGRLGAFCGPMIGGAMLASPVLRDHVFTVLAGTTLVGFLLMIVLRASVGFGRTLGEGRRF